MELLNHMIEAPLYDQLRTKEQLGYVVWNYPDNVHGYLLFRVLIQSPNKTPLELDERIEAFLKEFRETKLGVMPGDEFELNKKGVINILREKCKHISEQNRRWYREITFSFFSFFFFALWGLRRGEGEDARGNGEINWGRLAFANT